MTTNPLDPSFWEALGVTPIVINPEDSQSVEDGLAELTLIITEIIEQKEEEQ